MSATRTFTFLGTGTSVGVPMLGCQCPTCLSDDPRNQRYRCAVLITTPQGRLLIDTPPELRLQLLRAKVPFVHAVLLTHYHADHLHGLDDVRVFPHQLGGPLPLYCSTETESRIRTTFSYAFSDQSGLYLAGFVPQLRVHRIEGGEPFNVLGETVLPIPLLHAQFNVLGFRFGNVAYCTDVNRIPDRSMDMLEGLDVLVLDTLRYKPHPAHLSVSEALEIIQQLKPRRAYLTHLSHDLEYTAIAASLPSHVQPAFDGLSFEF
jgi:phosphoribosyl 1,2-cyclic phosphate phosphodiesterase